MKSKWQIALLSLMLGSITWFLVSFEEKVESTAQVRLEYIGQPQALTIRKGLADKISVRVRGPRSLVRALDAQKLGYAVDLAAIRPGENVIGLSVDKVPIPPPLEVVDISPQRLTVVAEELVEKTLPVRATLGGELNADWQLREEHVRPDQVQLRGPRSAMAKLEAVPTLPIPLGSDSPALYEGAVGLNVPEGVEVKPGQVDVQLVFGPKTELVWLSVPLTIHGQLPPRARLSAREVRLKLQAPLKLVGDKGLKDQVTAVVDIPTDLKPGTHHVPVRITVPEHVSVLETKPSEVTVDHRQQPAGRVKEHK